MIGYFFNFNKNNKIEIIPNINKIIIMRLGCFVGSSVPILIHDSFEADNLYPSLHSRQFPELS